MYQTRRANPAKCGLQEQLIFAAVFSKGDDAEQEGKMANRNEVTEREIITFEVQESKISSICAKWQGEEWEDFGSKLCACEVMRTKSLYTGFKQVCSIRNGAL